LVDSDTILSAPGARSLKQTRTQKTYSKLQSTAGNITYVERMTHMTEAYIGIQRVKNKGGPAQITGEGYYEPRSSDYRAPASNTSPIIRISIEARYQERVDGLEKEMAKLINERRCQLLAVHTLALKSQVCLSEFGAWDTCRQKKVGPEYEG
jgi:hypothetical protein